MNQVNVLPLVLGVIVLLAGRKIFWLAVGMLGLVLGIEVATNWFAGQSEMVVLVVACLFSVVGAIAAVLFERVAIAVAGSYAVAYLALMMMARFGQVEPALPVVILAGIAGAILAALLTDPAIIVLTALAGATAITAALGLTGTIGIATLIVLAGTGAMVQYAGMRGRSGR